MTTKVIAVAYDGEGALLVLVARGGRAEVVRLERSQSAKCWPAAPGVTRTARLAALPSGAVLTVTREGESLLVTASGKKKRSSLGEVVFDVAVIDGVAHAATARGGLFELEEATGEWWLRGAFEDCLKKLSKRTGEGDVHSLVATRRGLVAAVALDGKTLLLESNGKRWRRRAELRRRINAIAWRPETDTVFTVGMDFFAVDSAGRVTAVPTPRELERDHWSACWANGKLVVGTLYDVEAIDPDTGNTSPLLRPSPGAKEEVGHNHALASDGRSVAFVRAGALFVSSRGALRRVAIR